MQRYDTTFEGTEKNFSFFRNWVNNGLENFAVKTSTISEINTELLNDIFTEFDRSSPIKNITDKLNLVEVEVDNISAKFTA